MSIILNDETFNKIKQSIEQHTKHTAKNICYEGCYDRHNNIMFSAVLANAKYTFHFKDSFELIEFNRTVFIGTIPNHFDTIVIPKGNPCRIYKPEDNSQLENEVFNSWYKS